MSLTINQILNNVLSQSGFLERLSFTAANDPDNKQMVAIANRAAYEIMNFFKWPSLRTQFTITLTPEQNRYVLPADFQELVSDSPWELDGERSVEWPVPDGRWFMYKFTSLSDGGRIRVRQYGNEIEVFDPDTGSGFQFEYISKWPVLSAASERKEFFTEDDDTWLLDDQLLILAIQFHWQQTKQMPGYQEHGLNYYKKMNEAIGRVSGASTIGGVTGAYGYNRDSPYYPLWQGKS